MSTGFRERVSLAVARHCWGHVRKRTHPTCNRGEGWCPTIRITGRESGKPFMIVVDLFEVSYPTENAAIAAGEKEALERLQVLRAPEGPPSPYSPTS